MSGRGLRVETTDSPLPVSPFYKPVEALYGKLPFSSTEAKDTRKVFSAEIRPQAKAPNPPQDPSCWNVCHCIRRWHGCPSTCPL